MNNDTGENKNSAEEAIVQEAPAEQKPKKNRKKLLILSFVLVFLVGGFVGWRVMVRVWPAIKPAIMTNIVYKIMPSLEPEPPASELYTARSTATINDTFSATDTVIYYFYKDFCPYCKQLSPMFDQMPDYITLEDGTKSRVYIVSIEKQTEEGLGICEGYYKENNIPEDRSYVPAVIVGGVYMHGTKEISGGLFPAILSGEGLKTPMLGGNSRS